MRILAALVYSLAAFTALSPDPVLAATPLVNHQDAWRYRKGTSAPASGWQTLAEGSLDGTWLTGNGGFGYADNSPETVNCQTLLPDMLGSAATNYTTLYYRQTFTITNTIEANQHLYLRMDFDDGYIAWLDGTYLTNRFVTGAPAEPAYSATANTGHESSAGNSSPQPGEINDLGLATALLPAGSHTLAILGLNQSKTSSDFIQVADLYLDVPPAPMTNVWALSNSPITIATSVTVPANSMLLIEPGVTVRFKAGVSVTVNGQLIAAGLPDQRIKLTKDPAGGSWGGFSFVNARQSNVLAYADMEYSDSGSQSIYINASQVLIDRMTFFRITRKYFDIWFPQVTIRHSTFGDLGAAYFCMVENLDPDGWFVVDGNLFGLDTGDNDIFHLNHISVKDGPKAIIVNNVFTGAGDDHIDDNESDSHIEGNLFLNFTTNHPPRSASCAVTTGEGNGISTNLHTQRLTVVRNVFWGCDYGIINKDGSYVEVYNCVFVNNRGGIIFDEPWRTDSGPGRACYVEGCVFWNNWPENGIDQGTFAYLTNASAYTSGRYYQGATQVTVNHSLLPASYHYLGTGNIDGDPQFVFPTNLMSLSPTNPAFAKGFDGFDANAFLLTNHLVPDLHLLAGSAALGSGVNGSAMGLYVSDDATIAGEPPSPTAQTGANLTVAGLDLGSYRNRLVGAAFTNDWSEETQPWKYISRITLSGMQATASCSGHGYANGDLIEINGADSLCPYYNGKFVITNVTAGSFQYTVSPGTNLLTPEPLTITWPIRNEGRTDIWCRRPQNIQLAGLPDGTYRVEAVRKNSMGTWQDVAAPSVSKSWSVMSQPLRVESIVPRAGIPTLGFYAVAGLPYTFEYSDSLNPPAWQKLGDVPPSLTNGVQTFGDTTGPGVARFYRLSVPARR